MENKVCKSTLKVGDDFPIAEVFFLEKDLPHLESLLGSLYNKFKLDTTTLGWVESLPNELSKLFCVTKDFQFVYHTLNYNATSPSERLIRKLEREEVYQEIQNSRGIHDLLTNGTIFFTDRLLSEPVNSFKVKAISEMERIEKLLKEADKLTNPRRAAEDEYTGHDHRPGNPADPVLLTDQHHRNQRREGTTLDKRQPAAEPFTNPQRLHDGGRAADKQVGADE